MVNLQLFIRGNENQTVEIESTSYVSNLRSLVAQRYNLSTDDLSKLNLYYNGEPLNQEAKSLVDYNLINQTTIDIDFGLVGGKVHGSLARAGKVKGQTPKVAKQEKKKKKTGRAKRRLQYNRRFVNVVAGPGRKKGPNSNAQ
jgi:small subunit ribosomal protein S30e